jgi:hypothetical protein
MPGSDRGCTLIHYNMLILNGKEDISLDNDETVYIISPRFFEGKG